ncbi:TPA: hypothetical protein DIS60_02805 [Patescibacteria group bacterium]|nr:hypothetical protein [Patescibacteria group bacterium]
MKIFLMVSKTGMVKFEKSYIAVLEELKAQGAHVEATFVKTYLNKMPQLKAVKDLTNSEDTYRYVHDSAVRQAILRSDSVVVEASYPSFRLGFEAFFALSAQKPVLVLSHYHNYAHLIDQPHFFGAKYTSFTLPDEIEKFLRHIKQYKLRNRFNMFISNNQRLHIEKTAVRYNVSKSDYVRKLIEKDMSPLREP